MITVKAYGELKKVLGNKKIHTFRNCHNIKQLFNAIEANYRDFYKFLADNAKTNFYILINNKTAISRDNVSMQNFKDGDEIKIVPLLSGSGEDWGSVLTVVVGAILIWLSWGTNPNGWQMLGMGMGINMVTSGVSQLLFKPEVVEPSTYESSDKSKASYAFNGAVNLTSQGNAVPVGYGRLRVGSQVIGAGLYSVNL